MNRENNVNNTDADLKKKHKILNIIIIILIILIVSTLSLAFWVKLTKQGYIPNFLGIEVLCPEYQNSSDLDNENQFQEGLDAVKRKPVIYLYPTKKQDVEVKLDYKGEIFADYPEYDEKLKGWRVLAYPDGKLINYADGKEYSYLFWEGRPSREIDYDLSSGFVVKGTDTKEFLQKTLSQMGLTPKEYNEFIVYWFPKMQDNAYNLIHFAHEKYTDGAPLTIAPKPDSMLRVFMVFKPLEKPVEIEEQKLEHFERKGFSVVEWGGSEVK